MNVKHAYLPDRIQQVPPAQLVPCARNDPVFRVLLLDVAQHANPSVWARLPSKMRRPLETHVPWLAHVPHVSHPL